MKKVISLVLCLLLLCSVFSVSAKEPSKEVKSTHSNFELSIDRQTCVVSVKNKLTGEVYTTNPVGAKEDEYTKASVTNDINSQLIVSYYDEFNKEAIIGSYVSSVKRKTAKITEKENYIRVDYDFSRKNEQFTIPIEYTLSGNKLNVRILVEEIEERGKVQICEISLLPYFLSGRYTENGYVFIPDGSGAVIDFDDINPSAQSYKQKIYGRSPGTPYYFDEGNAESAYLPVFGMGRENSSVLAVVDGNEAAGFIRADCAGIISSYARAYTTFVYHSFDTVTIAGQDWKYKEYTARAEIKEKDDFSVSYYFIDSSDYTALADQYRSVLKKASGLKKIKSDKLISGAVKAYGLTTEKTAFLGVPYTKTIAATTLDDVESLLKKSKNGGGNIAVFLEDFSHPDSLQKKFKKLTVSSKVGGKRKLESIAKDYSDSAIFYQTGNILYENCSALWLYQSRYAKTVSKDYLMKNSYSLVTSAAQALNLYGLKKSLITKKGNKLISNFKNQENIGVGLEYFGSELYGDYNIKNPTLRQDMIEVYKQVFESAAKSDVNIAVSGANAYAAGYTDTVYNYPITSSEYNLQSRRIPFIQMALRGYQNMVSYPINLLDEPEKAFLLCVESGTVPCFAITGISGEKLRRTSYKDLFGTYIGDNVDYIVDRLSESAKLFDIIADSEIAEYFTENNLSCTTYENGAKVIVNFGETDSEYEGISVKSGEFEIIQSK